MAGSVKASRDKDGDFDPEFHMSCDGCGATGHKDAADAWFIDPETQLVYCRTCAEKRGLAD